MGRCGWIETEKNPSQQPAAPPPKKPGFFLGSCNWRIRVLKMTESMPEKNFIIATIGIGTTVAKLKRGNPEKHKSLLSRPGVCGNERIGKETTAAFLREGAGPESPVRPHPLLPL